MMTSTGRHLDETQAGIPNAPSERADLYGQSYCERHQGQLPKGRTQRPDIWAHRSRMRSAKEKRALDRGVVPYMGIPLRHIWLNPSTRPSWGGFDAEERVWEGCAVAQGTGHILRLASDRDRQPGSL